MVVAEQPPTPQLDAMLKVTEASEQIGAFVMDHLAEQGIVLARWMWEQLPCNKTWGQRADGSYIEISPLSHYGGRVRYDVIEIDPFECPCPAQVQEEGRPAHTYAHARWSLVQFYRSDSWINDELARFFGLDADEMDRERARLLAWIRDRNV